MLRLRSLSSPGGEVLRVGIVGCLSLAGLLSAQSPQPPCVSDPVGCYKPGFPAQYPGGGAPRGSQPAIADLGLTPGHKSIIVGTSTRKLFVFFHDGTVAPHFPVTLPGDICSSPTIGDLNGDGAPDIVVGFGCTLTPGDPGGLVAYTRTGQKIWQVDTVNPVQSSAAIGDVDGDGLTEVAFGALDMNLHLLRGSNGTEKAGWPVFVRDTSFSTPALADIDGDGKLDIVIGVDAHLEGPPYNTPRGGCLQVRRWDGSSVSGFPFCVDQTIFSSPAVGDIDGDGAPEIVFGTGVGYEPVSHAVYAVNCDGTLATNWPVSVSGTVEGAPALADLDGNGHPDVIVSDSYRDGTPQAAVYAFTGAGAQLFRTVPITFFGVGFAGLGDPIVADVAGDGAPEILVGVNTEIAVLTKTGVQLTDDGRHLAGMFSYYTETAPSGVAVLDMETDGQKIEVVAVSGAPYPTATNTKVFVWNPKSSSVPPWGMFHHDEKRTGVVPGTPACPSSAGRSSFYTVPPCRIVDTRWTISALGGPALAPQATRVFPLESACWTVDVNATAISVNVTVANSTSAAGDLRIYPAGQPEPVASSINFRGGQTVANGAVIKLPWGGLVAVKNDQSAGQVHFILDVNGYYK